VLIFLGALVITNLKPDWMKEEFHGMALYGKIAATLLVAAGMAIVGLEGRETSSGGA
jgi:hypothetical protein